jgi:hypothetical protein
VHVSVATTQVQPEPESAVTVRPVGGVSVTVTVPWVGDPPTFITLRVKVVACPGVTAPEACDVFVSWRSVPCAGGIGVTVIGAEPVLLEGSESPPPDTNPLFVIVPAAALVATVAVTVMSG